MREGRLFHEDLVVVRIGKRGVNQGVINEIRTVLKKKGAVKVKLLRNFRSAGVDRHGFARELARMVGAELVGVRGFVIVLRRSGEEVEDGERGQ